jgi:hypothetical protein
LSINTGHRSARFALGLLRGNRGNNMSIYLKLLPFYGGDSSFSHEVLCVDQDYELYGRIRALPSMKIMDRFVTYLCRDDTCEEVHYGDTIEDPYGDRLEFVLAIDLKKVGIPGPTGAYVAAMKDRDRIALYWN